GRRMPWTFGAFALASLSMIGAPPVAGFISKLYMLVGSLDAGSYFILAVLIVSSLLNAAYFAPVVYQAFFGKPAAAVAGHGAEAHGHGDAHGHHDHGEAPLAMLIPLCISAVISVVLGFYPDLILQFVEGIAK
ncbi:MAG TPA: proton-conducting transporter membrane subunit, partial [Opitutaceae bacterium]|nr:proton-conducting transporter membrane subunit [Opitutaceae bacterium]